MGGAVGFLSGMFGVGGGFLMTPLLIFYNIPPAVAVGHRRTPQIVASSFSGCARPLATPARSTSSCGAVLLAGGIVGSALGVFVFARSARIGQLDLFISLAYVAFLGTIGGLMLVESVRAHLARRAPACRRRCSAPASTTGSTACR